MGVARLQTQAVSRLLSSAPRRALISESRQVAVTQQIRRAHTETTPALPEPPKERRRFRKLRWLWRAPLLASLAGIAYVGWGVYEERNPGPQVEPDPSKKTLVVLGEFNPCAYKIAIRAALRHALSLPHRVHTD
jgi:NADH:ubiquinone reductase (non-electrogenic)